MIVRGEGPDSSATLYEILHSQQIACSPVSGLILKTEAYEGYKHPSSGAFVKSEKPSIATVWLNGIVPNRVKVEYQSKITPFISDPSSPFAESVESLSYDGASICMMTYMRSAASGGLIKVLRGRIQATGNGGPLRPIERIAVYGLTLPNVAIMSGIKAMDLKNFSDIEIEKIENDDQALPECVRFRVTSKSQDSQTNLWLDMSRGGALRRMESARTSRSASDKGGISQSIDVRELKKLEPGSFYLPVNTAIKTIEDGASINEINIVVKETKITGQDDHINYDLSFPVGARVQDLRS